LVKFPKAVVIIEFQLQGLLLLRLGLNSAREPKKAQDNCVVSKVEKTRSGLLSSYLASGISYPTLSTFFFLSVIVKIVSSIFPNW